MNPKIWPIPQIEYKSFTEVSETREVALVTSGPAWDAVKDRLALPCVCRFEVREADEQVWKGLLEDLRGEVVYAVGGGLAADTAKYLAAARGLPLVCLPTVLSVDAFLTWASGIRRGGCVRYLETKCPDRLVIDFEVLRSAPEPIRAAGVCDVLSIATGNWDWKYAEEVGKNSSGTPFIPYVSGTAEAILEGCLDCAEAAGRGDTGGLKQLLDCLALEVQLCNLIGHSRPEEGSEHYFAYSVENTMGKGLPHGDLVGPGILLLADLQGQDTAPLKRALDACRIPLENIPKDVARTTLLGLPEYCRKHNLAYGIAHDLNAEMIEEMKWWY